MKSVSGKYFLCFLTAFCGVYAAEEKPITVVIPSYHNAQWYKKNLDSVFNQEYVNYRVIYIADGDLLPDSDGTGALVEQYAKEKKQEHRFTLVRNADRQLALRNLYKAVLSCRDEEIVAILDGDDMFENKWALSSVNDMYDNPEKEIWFTYGNFRPLTTGLAWARTEKIPDMIVKFNIIRRYGNGPTHLKTFKAWLLKQIKVEDLFYENDFFKMVYDIALFEPMMEMTGRHFEYTHKVLYLYNDLNSLNDHRVNRKLQETLDHFIRAKNSYQPLAVDKCGRLDDLKERGRLKADIIIFSDSGPDKLRHCLDVFRSQVKNYGAIRVFYKTDKPCIADQYRVVVNDYADLSVHVLPASDSFEELRKILKHTLIVGSYAYALFIADTDIRFDRAIDLSDALYWLELTHASGFYPMHDKKMLEGRQFNPIQISLRDDSPVSAYAWRYKFGVNMPALLSGTLVRKSDVMPLLGQANLSSFADLEAAWKNSVLENKVGLAYRGII